MIVIRCFLSYVVKFWNKSIWYSFHPDNDFNHDLIKITVMWTNEAATAYYLHNYTSFIIV